MAEYHRIGKQAKKFFQDYSIKKRFPQVFKIEQIITNKKSGRFFTFFHFLDVLIKVAKMTFSGYSTGSES